MARSRPIRTAQNYKGDLSRFASSYKYQPVLTRHLDNLPDEPFSQEVVNEIVLWKVNRYVRLPQDVRDCLYALRTFRPRQHRGAEQVVRMLLQCHGIDLPMASTFLAFSKS
jgi:hypothetical protein